MVGLNNVMEPQISIIIPVYNAEKYLNECIESILIQSFNFFEVILIDDGSKDRSAAICDYFKAKDERVIVEHKLNEGVSIARNRGIELSSAKFISFIDADDYVDSKYLESIMDSKYDDTDVLFWGCKWFSEKNEPALYAPITDTLLDKISIEKKLLYLRDNDQKFEFFGYTWNKRFKKSIIDLYNIRFQPGQNVREDELFTLNYCTHIDSISTISNILYNYRVLDNSLTKSKSSYKFYLDYSGAVFQSSSEYEYNDFKNNLIEQGLKYMYIAFCNAPNAQIEENIFIMIHNNLIRFKKNYKPHSFRAKLMWSSRNKTILRSILILLKKIEKNKF